MGPALITRVEHPGRASAGFFTPMIFGDFTGRRLAVSDGFLNGLQREMVVLSDLLRGQRLRTIDGPAVKYLCSDAPVPLRKSCLYDDLGFGARYCHAVVVNQVGSLISRPSAFITLLSSLLPGTLCRATAWLLRR